MCETRHHGFRWPQRHTLMFSDEIRALEMRWVCPNDVKKKLQTEGSISVLEAVGSIERVSGFKASSELCCVKEDKG